MATEIAKESVAATMPQGTNINQAADVISGIINRGAELPSNEAIKEVNPTDTPLAKHARRTRNDPMETPDAIPDTPDVEQEAPRMEADEAPTQEQEPVEEPTAESDVSKDDASELELEPAQLAALLGLQEQDLVLNEDGGLAFHAKVDGKAMPVALSELRDSYQLTKTAQQRLSKLSDERKAFEAERKTALEQLQQQTEAMAQTIGQMEQEYSAEWQGVDWNRLREEDPTAYNLRRADFTDRHNRLAAYKAELERQRGEAVQKWQAHQDQLIAEGQQKLDEAMKAPSYANAPAWNQQTKKELVDFMVSEGVPIELINATPVWQAFNWARKAMLYDKAISDAKKTVKRVVKLPKVAKPGAQKTKAQVKSSKLQEARAKQRKAKGNLQSTADRISVIMRGG